MDKEASQERAEVKWAMRMSNLDRISTEIGLIIILTLNRTDLAFENVPFWIQKWTFHWKYNFREFCLSVENLKIVENEKFTIMFIHESKLTGGDKEKDDLAPSKNWCSWHNVKIECLNAHNRFP